MTMDPDQPTALNDLVRTASATPPSPPAAPRASRQTSAVARGAVRRLGLIGFPNSGKTSWLYSLVYGHKHYRIHRDDAGDAYGRRRWAMGGDEREFAAGVLRGTPEAPQQATESGVFRYSPFCQLKRLWIPGVPIGSRFWLEIPEISGETVRRIAEAGDVVGSEAASAEAYLDYLGSCETIVCFCGLDGDGVGPDGALSVDRALARPISGFGRLLTAALDRRKDKRHKIAVTVLLTKTDLLKRAATTDEVVLPRRSSSLGRIAADPRRSALAEELNASGSNDAQVRFRVNQLMRSKVAEGDLQIQECLAADFLRCHAPSAAQALAVLCGQEYLDVRFYLCAPYGKPSQNELGQGVFPSPDDLSPIMVYEPLENLLDRAWRARAGSRMLRRTLAAAILGFLLLVLGPLMLGKFESAFDRSISSAAPWRESESSLALVELHPLHHAEILVSESHRRSHAARLLDLRRRMLDGEVDPGDSRIVRIEREAFELHPDAPVEEFGVVQPLRAVVARRGRRALEEFLTIEGAPAPAEVDLTGEEVVRIATSLAQIGPRNLSAAGWADLWTRLQSLDLIAPDAEEPIRVRASGNGELLRESLERLASLAAVRRLLGDPDVMDSLPLQELAALAVSASRGGDADAVRAVDELLLKRLSSRWEELVGSSAAESPRFAEFLDAAPEAIWLRDAYERHGREAISLWVDSIGRRVDAHVEEAKREGPEGTVRPGLALAIESIDDMQRTMQSLDTERDRWIIDQVADDEREMLSSLVRRQSLLDSLSGSDALSPSLPESVRTQFATSDEEHLVVLSGDDGRQVRVSFAGLAAFQRVVLGEILDSILLSRMRSGDRTARIAFDSLRASQDPAAASSATDAALLLTEGALLLTEELALPSPSETVIRGALARFASRPSTIDPPETLGAGGNDRGQAYERAIVESLGRSTAFERVAGWMAENADGRLLRRILVDVPPEKWAELDAERIGSLFDSAVASGLDPILVGERLSSFLQTQALDQDGGSVLMRNTARQKLLQILERVMASPGRQEVARVLGPTMRQLYERLESAKSKEDFTSGGSCGVVIELLEFLRAGGVRGPAFDEVLRLTTDHARKVTAWDLVIVAAPTRRPFWLGRFEWTRSDILDLRDTAEFKAAIKAGDFPYGADGCLRRSGTAGLGEQSLYLTAGSQAKELVAAAGLRLPTRSEWREAFARPLNGNAAVPPSGKNVDKTDPKTLEALGDVQVDGVVGLRFGVREWVTDADGNPTLIGGSNGRPDLQAQLDNSVDPRTNGIRAALDQLPKELEELLTKSIR